jgi:hypothetical protein
MPRFITRVELHYADKDDYETLHPAMEGEGFSQTIRSDEGVVYHLPTAEYDRQGGNLTRNDVLESAKKAASTTGCKFGAIVTEFSGCTWSGLAKA